MLIGAIRGSRTSGQDEGAGREIIDEVAERVSFTVETTVLPSFALPRDCCSGVSVSAGRGCDSAVIDSRYKPARRRAIRVHWGYSWFKDIRAG